MYSRSMICGVVNWLGIALCDCSSFCFIHFVARLRSIEVNSEVTSNDTIRSSRSRFTVRSLSKNSFDNIIVS